MQGRAQAQTEPRPSCVSRRDMLIFGGSALAVLASFHPGDAVAQGRKLKGSNLVGSRYPAKVVAKVADLVIDSPIEFEYPAKNVKNVLIQLGEIAAAGVGPQNDIVAFNAVCTHMGGPIGPEAYKSKYKVLGPCPLHFTTFDLTRHGMVVSGHATSALPQVMLEIRNGEIVAVGMMGLVYGYAANPKV